MSDYTCTTTQVTIHRQGDNPLTTSEATVVSLDDAGASYVILIRQYAQGNEDRIVLAPDELSKLLEAVQILLQAAHHEPFAGRGLTADERAMCLEVIGSDRGNRAHQG